MSGEGSPNVRGVRICPEPKRHERRAPGAQHHQRIFPPPDLFANDYRQNLCNRGTIQGGNIRTLFERRHHFHWNLKGFGLDFAPLNR